jgi:hypothetical protein
MDDSNLLREKILLEYKPDVEKLIRYVPYFQSKAGKDIVNQYEGSGIENSSLKFPVYDSDLIAFINMAKNTKLMNPNYVYVYSKKRIRDTKDEWSIIEHCEIRDFDVLCGILSKYVLKGMTKASIWTEGVENKIFLKTILKMKEIIDYWDGAEHTDKV